MNFPHLLYSRSGAQFVCCGTRLFLDLPKLLYVVDFKFQTKIADCLLGGENGSQKWPVNVWCDFFILQLIIKNHVKFNNVNISTAYCRHRRSVCSEFRSCLGTPVLLHSCVRPTPSFSLISFPVHMVRTTWSVQ